MRTSSSGHSSLARRLLWFAALWFAGVATVAAISYGIRSLVL